MRQEGKRFFFEKKKQKTFDSAVAPDDTRRLSLVRDLVAIGTIVILVASAVWQGFPDNKLYLGVLVLMNSGALELLDHSTFNNTPHAPIKLAAGISLLGIFLLAIVVKVRLGADLKHMGLVSLPTCLIAHFVIRPVWLKRKAHLINPRASGVA